MASSDTPPGGCARNLCAASGAHLQTLPLAGPETIDLASTQVGTMGTQVGSQVETEARTFAISEANPADGSPLALGQQQATAQSQLTAAGDLAIVLHAHLPYVRSSEPGSLEEDWYFQALQECYLPLLAVLEAAATDPKQNPRLTLGLSPTLLSLLADEQLNARFSAWLQVRRRLLELLDPQSELQAAAQQLAERYGIATVSTDCMALIADPSIDAVLICTPTDTHAAYIIAAAQHGKHIFCEKPVALDLAQTDRALAAVAAAGVTLQIGFNRRFDANFGRMQQAVASGAIGTPKILHIVSRDPAPPPISYIKVSGHSVLW